MLIPGNESEERVLLFLALTGVKSPEKVDATIQHLVKGAEITMAATLYDLDQSNLRAVIKKLEAKAVIVEKIKEVDWAKFKKQFEKVR